MDRPPPKRPSGSRAPRFTRELRDRVLRNEPAAIDEFCNRLLPFLRGTLTALLKKQPADELELDSLVADCAKGIAKDRFAVLAKWQPDGGASLDGFLWHRARWTLSDALRRARTQPAGDTLDATDWSTIADVAQLNPEQQVALRQRVDLCRKTVGEAAFDMLCLKYVEGLTGEEIIAKHGGDPRDKKQRDRLDKRLSRLCRRLLVFLSDKSDRFEESPSGAGDSGDYDEPERTR